MGFLYSELWSPYYIQDGHKKEEGGGGGLGNDGRKRIAEITLKSHCLLKQDLVDMSVCLRL